MAASVEGYVDLVKKAYDGKIKLPAFQRDWKWKSSQVTLLFDSLRQGFPVGGFLFIRQSDSVDLSPREFRGSGENSSTRTADYLVLDGQQRITAGLELFYGKSGRHYFIDLNKIYALHIERDVDVSSPKSIKKFLSDLDDDDKYCIARRASGDPDALLIKSHLLWTAKLLDDDETKIALSKYIKTYPDRRDFCDYVIGGKFKPSPACQIPITSIDGDVPVEAISRIFSTLRSC